VTHKLLLADDSATIQRVVELTFSGEDVSVVSVGDGEEAIARIPSELPDIVLADIGMPKRSGYDVAAFVKGRSDLRHIPVLLLAGAFELVDEARVQQVHCDGVLVKPFEPRQVVSRVRELLDAAHVGVPPAPGPAPEPIQDAPIREAPSREAAIRDVPVREAAIQEAPIEDYFERLSAAFVQRGSETERPDLQPVRGDVYERHDVPTIERLLAQAPSRPNMATPEFTDYLRPAVGQSSPGTRSAPADRIEPTDGRNLVADMFAALFAVEQGEAAAPTMPLSQPGSEAPAVSEALVDEVTRRVIQRLAPDTASTLVRQIVSEVAERLIREEITRIKSAAGSRQ